MAKILGGNEVLIIPCYNVGEAVHFELQKLFKYNSLMKINLFAIGNLKVTLLRPFPVQSRIIYVWAKNGGDID